MSGSPSVTLPKPPAGWVYTGLTLYGPGGRRVTVNSVDDDAYRVTTEDIDGAVTVKGLRPAIDKALAVARGLSAVEDAQRRAEAGRKALEGLLTTGMGPAAQAQAAARSGGIGPQVPAKPDA